MYLFNEHKAIRDCHKEFDTIYTDGSKIDEKVGAAATWDFGELKTQLPKHSMIFSAEAVALKKFIVFTDSLSCLQSIQNKDLKYSYHQVYSTIHKVY